MRTPIAVIGIAARLPGADSITAFRANLLAGVDSVRPIPAERIASTGLDPSVAYPELGYLDRIDLFDHAHFGLSRREAEVTDPQHRLALHLTHEALENAGYAPAALRDSRTAVVFSSPHTGYASLVREPGTLTMVGNIPCMLPARISHLFGFTGPSYGVDTGCNGSLVAVHQASRELRDGDADFAVVGGVSLRPVVAPVEAVADFPGISSPTARSRAFDHAADGAGGGEGGAVLLLTTLDRAIADDAHVYAVIRGSSVVHNGAHSATIATPSARSQAAVIAQAWRGAGLDIDTAGYVEAHGSGTRLGDAVEAEGLALARAGGATTLPIGSVKTNLGHLDHAAGITGLVKTMLSVHHGELYPSLHFEQAAEEVDLDGARLDVVTTARPWAAQSGPRRAGVSSFSLGGINAHCVVEQAPAPVREAEPDGGARLVGVSARTPAGLVAECERLSLELRDSTRTLADVARTLNEGRDHEPYRVSAVVRRTADLAVALAAEATWQRLAPAEGVAERPRVVLLFSGDATFDEYGAGARADAGSWTEPDAPLPDGLPVPADRATLVRRHLAAHARLTRSGIVPDGLMSSGIARYTVRHLQGGLSDADRAALARTEGESAQPADPERLRAAADAETGEGPVVFVELADRGELGDQLREYFADRPDATVLTLGSDKERLLTVLARLYRTGHAVDWPALTATLGYANTPGRRIPLPGRPLNGVPCWVRSPKSPATARGTARTGTPTLAVAAPAQAAPASAGQAAEAHASAAQAAKAPAPPTGTPALAVAVPAQAAPAPAAQAASVPAAQAANAPAPLPVAPTPVPHSAPTPSGASVPESATVPDWLCDALAELLHADEVAVTDDYFAIGGSSIIALQLVEHVRQRYGVHLKLVDVYDHPVVGALAAAITTRLPQQPTPPTRQTHSTLSPTPASTPGQGASDGHRLPPIVAGDDLVLSYGQERMWFHHQLDPDTTLYNLPGVARHRGPFDPEAIRLAWGDLADRHEALRSNFVETDGRPRLTVRPELGDFFRYEDLSAASDPEAAARAVVKEATDWVFDLARDPLVRVTVVRLAPDDHLLCWVMHHAVNDGWAPQIQAKELRDFYAARSEGRVHRLDPLPVQYRHYARWQRDLLDGGLLEGELDYWREQLADPPALALPTDRPRPTRMDFAGAAHGFTIPAELVNRLRAVGTAEATTLFTVLLTGLKLLLSRQSGQRDIVIGTPTIGRSRPELWGLLGFFNNTVALRSDLSGDPTFRELLRQVRGVVLGALDHQEIPFDRIVREVADRDSGRNPIFDVMYVHQTLPPDVAIGEHLFGPNSDEDTGPYFPGLPPGTAKFDLTMVVAERAGEESLDVVVEYATRLFDPDTVTALCDALLELLEAAATDADIRYGELPAGREAKPEPELTPARDESPVSGCLQLQGEVDEAALRSALDDLAERHHVLRSRRPGTGDALTLTTTAHQTDPLASAHALAREQARLMRASTTGPRLRALLVTTGPSQHVLVVSTRPEDYDGGQPELFFRDLFALYEARLDGRPAELPALPVQYEEYARWQRELRADGLLDQRLTHWRDALAGVRALDLPADRSRPVGGTGEAAVHDVRVPEDLAGTATAERLLAGIAALLGLRAGADEAVIGLIGWTPDTGGSPGRRLDDRAARPEVGELIGPFAGGLPLRVDLGGDPTFDTLTERVRRVLVLAEDHRDVPPDDIARAAGLPGEPGRTPLFDVTYAHHRVPRGFGARAGLDISAVPWHGPGTGRLTLPRATTVHDLAWSVTEGPGAAELYVSVEYRTELFDAATVTAIADDLVALLRAAVGVPDSPLSALRPGAREPYPDDVPEPIEGGPSRG
ncbi:condensation domain-containing protein [Streptomyces sp. NBC_01381]|uniref:condensation domain-containing protein n=1 Tax=Streptomyces sp. NBC_01381 TaxID=2903845 RepID=UPI00224E2759|nr:condensation domain-containing protein [Streptomyces sp. NBC_01381]MCX4670631.1 condensation domain-containing protein [Streptomyces sp. NBC_01381]